MPMKRKGPSKKDSPKPKRRIMNEKEKDEIYGKKQGNFSLSF